MQHMAKACVASDVLCTSELHLIRFELKLGLGVCFADCSEPLEEDML